MDEVILNEDILRNYEIDPEAKAWLGDMCIRLKSYYLKQGRTMNHIDLLVAIEKLFGAEIVEKLCIPRHIKHGACLIIARAICEDALAS